MRKNSFIILGLILLAITACKRNKNTDVPEGYIEYQGEILKENDPIRYDSNGDGVIDEKDKTIGVLGTNLNITQNPDGSPFYSGSGDSGEGGDDGSENPNPNPAKESKVPVGTKLCYMDLEKYCSQDGGLYAYETTVNAAQSSSQNEITNADANTNGIPDYIENIRSTSNISSIATQYAGQYAVETEKKIEKGTNGKQIGAAFVKTCLTEAIEKALTEALYESNESIDISNLQTIINTRIIIAIGDAVTEAGLLDYIDNATLASIATEMAGKISANVANAIASTISKEILSQYEKQIANGSIKNVQGICPNGYHIPSDIEWMIFEQALGMSASDLTKSGETEITRGADVNIVKKLVNDYGFNFGGYASINGTFAQRGEAGVYWSSTTGKDENGDFVWVRQIDTSYTGVVRFKMYEKSGLSIRCFKD
ncbi:MAG: fibrobacter succinogenes major paralogous domain-containing protein [Bacteroidales bacterium]|nr:fibrobacter succinogenes major paralogous domain-containing protein [Bacteroidales bacterium]